jgi:hypothetical protein
MSKAKQADESTMNLTMPSEIHTKLKVVCMARKETIEKSVISLISSYVSQAKFKPLIEALEQSQ